jgi:adenosylcobinamide-GDP ribazoletransferase
VNGSLSVRSVRAAFVFLTRVPVGGTPYTDDEWRWAPAHFPLVGAILGALVGALDRCLSPLGGFAAALGALAASLLLTGAFHEDGFADTCDALGGGFEPEKIAVILKDPRVGTFGACALVLSIAGRAALLARLGAGAPWALVLVGAAARVGPVCQIAALPYVASAHSRSRAVARAGRAQASLAVGWWLVVSAGVSAATGMAPGRLLSVGAAVTVVTLVTGWRYVRRFGGVTGDFLGATEQLCELAALGALGWSAS